jgi:hypothetical protein
MTCTYVPVYCIMCYVVYLVSLSTHPLWVLFHVLIWETLQVDGRRNSYGCSRANLHHPSNHLDNSCFGWWFVVARVYMLCIKHVLICCHDHYVCSARWVGYFDSHWVSLCARNSWFYCSGVALGLAASSPSLLRQVWAFYMFSPYVYQLFVDVQQYKRGVVRFSPRVC